MERRNNSIVAASLSLGVSPEAIEKLLEQKELSNQVKKPYDLVGRYESEIKNLLKRCADLVEMADEDLEKKVLIEENKNKSTAIDSLQSRVDEMKSLIEELSQPWREAEKAFSSNKHMSECGVMFYPTRTARINIESRAALNGYNRHG